MDENDTSTGSTTPRLAANDPVETQKRDFSYGKLLHLLPLPGHPASALSDYDLAPDPTLLPAAADRTPYSVSLFISQASGLTRVLDEDTAVYSLTRSERLLLNSVVLAPEDA